jgi:hypothetical protein
MPISNYRAAEKILLWIHKGQAVTVWSSVLWTNHLDFYPKIRAIGRCKTIEWE